MSNGFQYEKQYNEWLEEIKLRHPRLKLTSDPMLWKFGQMEYPDEASRVQPPQDFLYEEEKTIRALDDEALLGRWLPESVQMVLQKSWNDGVGGLMEMADTGEVPYSLIDKNTGKPYEYNWIQSSAAIAGSLITHPIDAITMGGGSLVGWLTKKGILRGVRNRAVNQYAGALGRQGFTKTSAMSQASKRVAEKFSDKHFNSVLKQGWKGTFTASSTGKKFTIDLIKPQPFARRWLQQSAPLAGQLSAYHAVGAVASRRLEKSSRDASGKWIPGEITKEDIPFIVKEASIGLATGLTLGHLQTIMGVKMVGKSKWTKRMLKTGEFAGEIAIFGSIPNLLHGQLPNLSDEGELIWTKNGMPVQFQDEEGNLRNYSVAEGMKHSAVAIASIKGWHRAVNSVAKIVGDRVRERTPEIIKLKKERDVIDKLASETDSNALKTELEKTKNKITERLNSLEKENIEGFDESSYENIIKIDKAVLNNKEPKKDWIDKAEVELENIKEYIHKKRSELDIGEELSEADKELSLSMNRVSQHINAKKEKGWIDDRKILVDKNKEGAEKRTDLEADFESYLELRKEGKEPRWKTVDEALEHFDGNIDNALRFFAKYFERTTPQSKSDSESNKILEKVLSNQEKLLADPTTERSIAEAEAALPSGAIDKINSENITETDKGILKSLLHNIKTKIDKSNIEKLPQLIGETRSFAKWLNTKGKTLKEASQALFDEYMKNPDGSFKTLATESKRRYERQFEAIGLDKKIDLTRVKVTVPKEKVILTTGEYKKNIAKTTKKLEGEGDVNITEKKKIPKFMARVIMNLKSRWGHRDTPFIRTAKKGGTTVGDVEFNKEGNPYGMWVTEKATKEFPAGKKVFRFLEQDIIPDVKSLTEGKKKTDLLFSTDGKTPLSEADMSSFSLNFISYGKEGVTGHRIRHFLINAAKYLDGINKGKTNFTEFTDRFLLLHPPGKGQLSPASKSYLIEKGAAAKDFATFKQFMKQLERVEDVDLNKKFTKAERERISEEIAAMEEGKGLPGEPTELVRGSAAAKERLKKSGALDIKSGLSIEDVSKGKGKIRFEFNNKNPNYSLKDKLADASLVGAEIIARGTKTLKDFTTEMQARFGPTVNKYVKQLYESSAKIFAERPETIAPDLMKKMGIKPEDIISDLPIIEADKIIKQVKKKKYDDIELDKEIVRKNISMVAKEKGLTDKRLNDEVFEALGFYDKNGKPSIEGVKTESDLSIAYEYIKKNYPEWREPEALQLEKMIQEEQKLLSHKDGNWNGAMLWSSRFLPTSKFLSKYGGSAGKWISKKMEKYVTDYRWLVGVGDSAREIAMNYGLSEKELNMMALMDRKSFSERLTVEQERFQHDMFNVPESPQYKAREVINKLFNDYIVILRSRLKDSLNPRTFEQLDKWLTDRMVKDYFTKRISKAGSKYFEHDDNGQSFIRKAIEKKHYNEIVIKDKKYLEVHNKIRALQKKLKDPSTENKVAIENEIQKLKVERSAIHEKLSPTENISIDMETFYNQLKHSPDKLIHPNLDYVSLDLPEFLPNGKRTYEMNWDATVGGYIRSSSKFIAAITHFPSLTSWANRKEGRPSVDVTLQNKLINIYANKGNAFGKYTERQLKNLVIGSENAELKPFNNFLRRLTAFSSTTGLSSPFSGWKNHLIGSLHNYTVWDLATFIEGYMKYRTPKAMEDARVAGAFETGSKHLQELGINKFVMKHASRMQSTEHGNRSRAIATSNAWLTDALSRLRGEKGLWNMRMGSKKWIKDKLNNYYEMSDKDIDFFKEHGLNESLIPVDTPNYNKVIAKHKEMMQHLATRAHVGTQGATSIVDLPGWMNEGGFKQYSTLFYRMAYSSSINTINHTFKPFARGNPLPLFRLMAAGIGSGALYWQVKHAILGTEPDHKYFKGKWLTKLWENSLAVETFSLYGSVANSIKRAHKGQGALWEYAPVIVSTGYKMGEGLFKMYDIATGKYTKTAKIKAIGQNVDETMAEILVAYNHYRKARDKMRSPEIARYEQAEKIIHTFTTDNKISNPRRGGFNWNEPLFKAIEKEILLGGDTPESMQAAAELYWVARMEIRDKIIEEFDLEISFKDADKKAKISIEGSLRSRIKAIPYSKTSIEGRDFRAKLFKAVNEKGAYILRKAEVDSEKRLENFYEQVREINSDSRYTYW